MAGLIAAPNLALLLLRLPLLRATDYPDEINFALRHAVPARQSAAGRAGR